MTRYNDRLVHGDGMGGYLDPPGYPTHVWRVESGSRSNPHSLSSIIGIANESPSYADPLIIERCQKLIDDWKPQPIDSPEVVAWIADCKRHWAHCWYPPKGDRYNYHAWSANMTGNPTRPDDALDYATHHIRKFYPDYVG